jgi:hypothetical protein
LTYLIAIILAILDGNSLIILLVKLIILNLISFTSIVKHIKFL